MIPVPKRHFGWWCPGCEKVHWLPVTPVEEEKTWGFARDASGKPTLTPSVLTYPHNYLKDDGTVGTTPRCHLFIRAGQIEFLADCTHPFAGKTVPCEERTEMEP